MELDNSRYVELQASAAALRAVKKNTKNTTFSIPYSVCILPLKAMYLFIVVAVNLAWEWHY